MTSESIEKILLVVLGWLLGLLAPVIVDAIKRRRENELGRIAIRAELLDLAHKLALASHYIHMHQGTVDKTNLSWLRRHLESYPALVDSQPVMNSVRMQLSMPDEEHAAFVRLTAAEPGRSIVLQKYPVPLLDARDSALWSFDNTLQRQLLDIRTRIELLNDLVDRSRKYSDMTFGKLEGGNYDLVVQNIEQAYKEYALSAEKVVDLVAQLER